jgi:DNA-binding IclR family transcriptional regulator
MGDAMGRLVPAVTRALDILELFLEGDGTLSAPEVTRKLQLPRTTVHELLTTLASRSYLVPLPEQPGRYRLGVRTYQLGSRYAEQLDLAAEGQRVAREVAETCDETVHVAILEDTDVIYIAKVDSTHAVRMVSAAGRHDLRQPHRPRRAAGRAHRRPRAGRRHRAPGVQP